MEQFTNVEDAMDGFDYDALVQNSLRNVVRQVFKKVAKSGLPGNHHFYITFETNRPDVMIPPYLLERHPDEITVVMQHQFWDLEVTEKNFTVTLSFNDIQERVTVSYDAIISFLDPAVKFGLQFIPEEPKADHGPKSAKKEEGGETGKVVELSAFRKK